MRYDTHDVYGENGDLVSSQQVPWDRARYSAEIADKEREITPRRLREAVLTLEGADWLSAKEAEIAALREEMENV